MSVVMLSVVAPHSAISVNIGLCRECLVVTNGLTYYTKSASLLYDDTEA